MFVAKVKGQLADSVWGRFSKLDACVDKILHSSAAIIYSCFSLPLGARVLPVCLARVDHRFVRGRVVKSLFAGDRDPSRVISDHLLLTNLRGGGEKLVKRAV